jgi:hypothetical protein
MAIVSRSDLFPGAMSYVLQIRSKDLSRKLQHRFDDLPVHRLCYYQSYYPMQHRFDDLPVHRLCYYQSYYPMQLAVRAMFRIDTNNRAHTNNRALGKTIMLLSNDIEKITTNQPAFHV